MERRVLADRQGLIARGVSENLPTLGLEQAAFDVALEAEPERLAPLSLAESEQMELRRALGVA